MAALSATSGTMRATNSLGNQPQRSLVLVPMRMVPTTTARPLLLSLPAAGVVDGVKERPLPLVGINQDLDAEGGEGRLRWWMLTGSSLPACLASTRSILYMLIHALHSLVTVLNYVDLWLSCLYQDAMCILSDLDSFFDVVQCWC